MLDPLEAAQQFVSRHFHEPTTAFVAGSVLRGEGTPTSDLDIVIVTERPEAPYRESFHEGGWPIEAFVHTRKSLSEFFAGDAKRRRPSLPTMCAEGQVVKDELGLADGIRQEAQALLLAGPPALTPEEIARHRYILTDLLDDLAGCRDRSEGLFIAAALAQALVDFQLAIAQRWTGHAKWSPRALRRHDPALETALTGALEAYYRQADPRPLLALTEAALAPVGGRLFEGYSAGKSS